MSHRNNYSDFVEVTNDMMISKGFVLSRPDHKGETSYYSKESSAYALGVIGDLNNGGYMVIMDRELFERICNKNIILNRQDIYKPPVPCIIISGKNVRMHRLQVDTSIYTQVDHINRNQSCCCKFNLRACNNSENNMNRCREMYAKYESFGGIKEYEGYAYEMIVDNSRVNIISELKGKGLRECGTRNKGSAVLLKSRLFDSKVDCLLSYRDNNRLLHRETRLEQFVYDIENDFSDTLGLIVHCLLLENITEDEMYQMNLANWRDKVDSCN